MFASMQTVGQMVWHYENRRSLGVRHLSDGKACKHFDWVGADFAIDPHSVRLGLCSNDFTPHIQASDSPYSVWLVIVTLYNLPLEMCMSKPYMVKDGMVMFHSVTNIKSMEMIATAN